MVGVTFGTPNTKQLSEPSKPCASGISPVIVPPKIGTTLGTNYSLVLKIRTLELFKYITSRPVRHIEEMGYVQDQSAPGIRAVSERYKNQIKIIFRDYPLHDNSIDLALAARCAGEQGKFWEFHDYLFTNQNKLTDTGEALQTKLSAAAQEQKINVEQFTTCLTDKKYLQDINTDFQDGETLQVQGTPTWFVNNYRVTGALSEQKLEELINGLLK